MKKFLSKVAVHFSRHKNIYIGVLLLLFAVLIIYRTSCLKASLPSKIAWSLVGMIGIPILLFFDGLLLYLGLSLYTRDNIQELIAPFKVSRWRDICFSAMYLVMDVSCFVFTYKYLKNWGFILFGFGGLGIPFLLRGDNPKEWGRTIYGVISWLEVFLFSLCVSLILIIGSLGWILQIIFMLLGVKVDIIKFK